MTHVLRETLSSLRTWPVFAFYVLVTLAVAGTIALITVDVIDLGMTHFGEASHRTHDVTYGLLFTTLVVGTLAQLRRPDRNVAGMAMALVPVAGLLLVALLANDVDAVFEFNPLRYAAAVTAVAALLHPTGRAFFRSFGISQVNRELLVLVGIVAGPLLAFASTSIGRQRTVTDMHVFMGHYGFMAAFSITVIAAGLLASIRPVGWRLTAWVAGLLPASLGATSLLYPDATSSLDTLWALAAITWGATFIAAASFAKDTADPRLLGSGDMEPPAERLVGARPSR